MTSINQDLGCEKRGVAQYCNNRDIKLVQLRSQCSGPNGKNEYKGDVVQMCSECRKCNSGGFKIVKN